MTDQNGLVKLVILDEMLDVLGHGEVVMSWIVRRVAVVSQILLPNLVSAIDLLHFHCLFFFGDTRTMAYTSLFRSCARRLSRQYPVSTQAPFSAGKADAGSGIFLTYSSSHCSFSTQIGHA